MSKPPAEVDKVKCSACGMYCDLDSTPRGGQFYNKSATKTINGQTVYYDDNGDQGCPFCGSPAWDSGASLGDCSGWWTRRH